jgi:hypothetical protein
VPPQIGLHLVSPLFPSMGKRWYSVCYFHGCIPVGMVISTKSERLILESTIELDNSCSSVMVGLRRIRYGSSMS